MADHLNDTTKPKITPEAPEYCEGTSSSVDKFIQKG
jgi:hypothetical protein